MKQLATIVGVILVISHVLTETHGFLYHIYPKSETIYMDLFWSSSFKMKLSLLWYIKTIFDDLLLIVIFFCMAKIALEISVRLYLISIIFMLYHAADAICFMYNYKQTWEIYIALLYCSTASVFILILPPHDNRNRMRIVK